jgi:hypothetical protein
MKIYISHSRAFDFKAELYQPLKNSDLAQKHQFIFSHDKSDDLFDVEKSLTDDKIDLVVAEVSHPSTGQGMELAWSNAKGIKILCFYKIGSEFSSSLNKVSQEFIQYKNSEELDLKLSKILL